MSKPEPVEVSKPFSLLPPYGKYTSYRIEWNNKLKRRIDGLSTGTTDLQEAKTKFHEHCLKNSPGVIPQQQEFKDEPAATAMSRYYLLHACNLPSANGALQAMNDANDTFQDKYVSKIDATEQLNWITTQRNRGIADSTITRRLGVLFAAFNHAAAFNHISQSAVPKRLGKKRWGPRTTACIQSDGGASRRQLTLQELGRICDVVWNKPNALRYFVLALGTAARPIALLRLTPAQFDKRNDVLDLNPIGHVQNSKYHAKVPLAPIVSEWLRDWEPRTANGHYLGKAGKVFDSVAFFRRLLATTGVRDCVPYTFRHTVASWLATHGVAKWSRKRFLGHSRPDGNVTDDYSHCEPEYLRDCAAAIQLLFESIAPYTNVDLLRHRWDDQPTPNTQESIWLDDFLMFGHRLHLPSRPSSNDRVSAHCGAPDPNPAGSIILDVEVDGPAPMSDQNAWRIRGTDVHVDSELGAQSTGYIPSIQISKTRQRSETGEE